MIGEVRRTRGLGLAAMGVLLLVVGIWFWISRSGEDELAYLPGTINFWGPLGVVISVLSIVVGAGYTFRDFRR